MIVRGRLFKAARPASLLVLALAFALGLLGSSRAATPGAGTVSDANRTVDWVGPPKAPALSCGSANNSACDNYKLTIVPPSYQFQVVIKLQPFVGDWDLEVYGPSGAKIDSSGNAAGQLEVVTLTNPAAGTYTVAAVPFTPAVDPTTGNSYTASATLQPIESTQQPPPGNEPLTYGVYPAPNGLGTDAGEPSIGANWKSGRTMVQAGLQTLRIAWDDCSSPAAPDWKDVSFLPTSTVSLDPIGYCDSQTGRWFTAQLSGTTSLMASTDDDGTNWVQEQGPLNGGVDHETVGGGPFHSPLTRDPNGLVYPDAVYYCSQDAGPALCARSDNGGLNFGPAVPMWTTECGGLHGHVKVAPDDGTVYVPNKSCGGKQGVAVSENNGLTWTVHQVPKSSNGTWDPSVAIGSGGTVYFAYGDGDGHMKVAVSHDHGATWGSIRDVGQPLGVVQTAFPAAVAGDDNRAAVSWLGSTSTVTGASGDDPNWPGEWHLYVATTYDGGNTWTTVDATPNDPVQRGSICAGGTLGCPNGSRNLLDFNDMTVDKYGRVLAVFADGCTGSCITGPPNTRSALATVVRQVNGKRLFSAYDTLAVPDAPAVTAKADSGPPAVNHVFWSAPDDHGSPITGYRVYRKAGATGDPVLLASVGPTVHSYDDGAIIAGQTYLYGVSAVNAIGESSVCRYVAPVGGGGGSTEDACSVPGITVATDPPGDTTVLGSSKTDIRSLSVAGLFTDGTPKLVFTMKVGDLSGALPPNTSWRTFWASPNGTQYFVDANDFVTAANPTGAIVFNYGTFNGTIFTTQGSADGGSVKPDGTISITIAASKIGNPLAGQALAGITGRTQQLVGAAGTGALATIDSAGPGSYVLRTCQSGAPIAGDDTATTVENQPVTINALANDSDPNGDSLTLTSVGPASHGTATNNGDGTITYRPNVGFTGVDHFTYTIQNSHGLTATGNVTVTVTPFCPRTPTGSFTDTFEPAKPGWSDDPAKNNLGPASPTWAVSTDPNAKSPSHSFFSDATTLDTKDDRLVSPAFDLSPTSQLTFWHRFGFESGFDGGVLEVSRDGGHTWVDVLDGGGSFAQNGYTGSISPSFGSPIAGRAAWTGGPVNAITTAMKQVVVNVGAFAGDGVRFRFRLAADPLAIGSLPGAGWWIDDVKVTNLMVVSACNKPPIAIDDSASTIETAPVTIDVLANDSDPENDSLTVTGVTSPAHGSATIANNKVTYQASSGFIGTDTFTYMVSDGHGNSSTANVSVSVQRAPNHPPVANDDAAETFRNQPVTVNVLANDTDPDGDSLSVTGTGDPPHGTAQANGDGTVTYTPDAGYTGSDSFSYTISDGKGGTASANVSITVKAPPNSPPDAVDDSATTPDTTPVTIAVLANDTDPDGDSLSVSSVTQPTNGTATKNADNTVTYSPNSGFVGTDTFTYSISDGRGGSDTATVTITVTPRANTAGKAEGDGEIAGGSFHFNAQVDANKSVAKGKIDYTGGGITLKGSVQALHIAFPNADFSGTCTYGGNKPCRYAVQVTDGKAPAARFSIQVYDAAGSLIHANGGPLTKGHIDVHN